MDNLVSLTCFDTSDKNFKTLINSWLYKYKYLSLKRTSFDRLECTIRNHIIPSFGSMNTADVTSSDIQSLINSMYEKGYSYGGIKKVYDCLNEFFRFCQATDVVIKSPMLAVMLPNKNNIVSNQKTRFLDNYETTKFINTALMQYPNGTYVYSNPYAFIFCLNTGLRTCELLGLNCGDVNLEKKYIDINKNYVEVYNREDGFKQKGIHCILQTPKTEGSNRLVPLNKDALEAVTHLLPPTDLQKRDMPLIRDINGSRLSPNALRKQFNRIIKAAGIEPCGVHALRHTFASKCFSDGLDLKSISLLLGHSSVSTTEKIYVHLTQEYYLTVLAEKLEQVS